MLIDFDALAAGERPPRRRAPHRPVPEVHPTTPLWDDELLDRIARDEADALERESVIRSLADYGELLDDIDLVPANQLEGLRDGIEVFVAGRRMSRSRDGSTVVVTLRDGSGLCEVVFAPERLPRGELVLVAGVTDGRAVRANQSWDLRELRRLREQEHRHQS
jgi:hypothetical protein